LVSYNKVRAGEGEGSRAQSRAESRKQKGIEGDEKRKIGEEKRREEKRGG